ncbi:Uracil catabolism protein 4 [Smittium culicis]|uniref:Uracil catabolism protein 4 n=1 Tax=Smittium culicis TaxID=133412 RepID=A0A1R1Y0V2_9FUNG|nr:Uracil catabolism protein 4 [Smittium culicis]
MTFSSTSKELEYFRSLEAVRERSNWVYSLVKEGKSKYFKVDEAKLEQVASFIGELIARDYTSANSVPAHGRWRSFEIQNGSDTEQKRDLVNEHIQKWMSYGVDSKEICRRVIDLFVVSVILDAGAGSKWAYFDSETNSTYKRTEGLGMASLRMFEAGIFSSDQKSPFQVDSKKLLSFSDKDLIKGFQVSESNPLIGTENRARLIRNLGRVISNEEVFFPRSGGKSSSRPGNMFDYLVSKSIYGKIGVKQLWKVIIEGFYEVWPKTETKIEQVSLGDAWKCDILMQGTFSDRFEEYNNIIPFHKLSMWLTWSLVEAIERVGCLAVCDLHLLTGLPEYRNGGLLVDMGVIQLNQITIDEQIMTGNVNTEDKTPLFEVNSQVVVEWRALTITLLDKLHLVLCEALGMKTSEFPLNKLLEAGSWKAGRELSFKLRPKTGNPPIGIISDGTVF